jgi:hypothetical protein
VCGVCELGCVLGLVVVVTLCCIVSPRIPVVSGWARLVGPLTSVGPAAAALGLVRSVGALILSLNPQSPLNRSIDQSLSLSRVDLAPMPLVCRSLVASLTFVMPDRRRLWKASSGGRMRINQKAVVDGVGALKLLLF